MNDEIKFKEELFNALFASKNFGILLTNTEGRLYKCNDTAFKMMGYTKEEFVNLANAEITHPDDIKATEDCFNDFLNGNKNNRHIEKRYVRKDGSSFWAELSVNPIYNSKNEIIAFFCLIMDITERKNADERVRLLSHTMKSLSECVSVTDTEDKIIFVNEKFLKTYGYTEDELIGKNISIVRSPNNDPEYIKKILPATKNGNWHGELLNRRKDGTDFPISISSSAVKNERGKIVALVGIATDITERKQTEKALAESEKKYRNLVESIPDGVYRSTPDGKFIDANPAMYKMLGYANKEELFAVDIKKQLYFDVSDRESAILQEELEEIAVYPLRKKDGSKLWVEDHGWLVMDEQNNIRYHEGILRDVTERRAAEILLKKNAEELRDLNATKDKFFSIIAHDLKSPFNSILGFSDLLINNFSDYDKDEIEKYLRTIESSSKQAFELLENLLVWARSQTGSIHYQPETIELKSIIHENINLLTNQAERKNIQIFSTITDEAFVNGDRNMINTILRNLLANAIKFTPQFGKIFVSLILNDESYEISIKDNGIGIAEENIPKLFRIDSKFSTLGTEKEKGTGLGLILCKEFVEKHGGKIWARSELGKGSTFIFSLKSNH